MLKKACEKKRREKKERKRIGPMKVLEKKEE
jgi:hypothetical protein